MSMRTTCRRLLGAITTGALFSAALVGFAVPASADTQPPEATTPVTVSADALPTVQIDGVVWSQVVVGNTVYAGGSFTTARPAGAAAGVNTTPRSNLLAYDITTGNLVTSFAPTLNAQVRAVAASPDGTKLYVGGDFTSADGQVRSRIAAYSIPSGQLISTFRPAAGTVVRALAATNSTVYLGGDFTSVAGVTRHYIAAVDGTTGAVLPFDPNADSAVTALTLNYDKSKVIVGGRFQHLGVNDAYGLAGVDPTSGAVTAWNAGSTVRNAGGAASITSLTADVDGVYGTGYVFGNGGNLEGAFRADNNTGDIVWVEDCHGDSYSTYPMGDVVYVSSHAHYCGNLGGFPQTEPWTQQYATAFSKQATGTLTADPYGYYNWAGTAAPTLLNWFPTLTPGSFTGQGQAGWSITGNSQYVVQGGEFRTANGTPQQGLVRYAVKSIAPNKVGPSTNPNMAPSVLVKSATSVRVGFQTTSDRDNLAITYKVYRDFQSESDTPVWTTTQTNTFWQLSTVGFTDTGLTPGKTYNYRVYAYDPLGNRRTTAATIVTMPATSQTSDYASAVAASGPSAYYRLDEPTGNTNVFDWANFNDMTAGAGVTRETAGAIPAETDTASTFSGDSTGFAATQTAVPSPDTFTLETWIKTTSNWGGKIIGFGAANTGDSGSYDRHVYMDNAGRLHFGVYTGTAIVVNSAKAYNDGQWHLVTASMGSTGMRLSVDGVLVGSRTDVKAGQPFNGFWRIGGDNLSGWPNRPTSAYFAGAIDETAVYPTVLSAQTVAAHYAASGRTSSAPPSPTDAYGAAVYDLEPSLYWRLDETSGTSAQDAGVLDNDGALQSGVTLGAAGALADAPTSAKAAGFDGNNDVVVATSDTTNPTVYSETIWFKTTTNRGGKLMGFGNAASGLSSSYDRHVYMESNGQLTFGAYTGQQNKTTSTASYNDGAWHFMVATQSDDGMKLYVDGSLVGTNPQTAAQDYTGYWRIGGDVTWGPQPWFNGTLDEAAVFSTALTQAQITRLYHLGAGINAAPAASFISTTDGLSASFDASESVDSDGSIASYLWDFGDGSATLGTGVAPKHTYTTGDTYTVTLTVTDDGGLTSVMTKTVTVISPPTAAFTSQVDKTDVAFNASTSTDADGTIATYEWTFGDGGSGVGKTPTHSYGTSGTWPVTLTVTDNQGNVDVITRDVVTVANVVPDATFTSSVNKLVASFDAAGSTDPDGTITRYGWEFGDGGTSTSKAPSHTYAAAGTYAVTLKVFDDDEAVGSFTKDITVSANVGPTARFTSTASALIAAFDGSASSDSDGTIASYSWDFGDSSAAGTGAKPSHTYAAAGTYTVKLTVTDNDGATSTVSHQVTVAANVAPVARFTSTTADLKATFDGSTSSDADGSVVSYSWDFGDGSAAGTGAKPSRTYAAAGTYTVKLTVTDNQGATGTVSHTVTVAASADPNLAADAFGRTVTGGFGSADIGGAWTVSGGASNFAVAGGKGQIKIAAAAAGPSAYLNAVSSTDTDVTVDVSLDKVATGGTYFALVGRGTSSNAYRGKVLVSASGAVTIYITKVVAGAETILVQAPVTGLTYAAGETLHLRLQAVGSGTTALKFKLWKGSDAEPSTWRLSTTDTTAALQSAGGVGLWTYLSASSTSAPVMVSFDNLLAKPSTDTPPPANVAPVAKFTSTTADLKASFDGSTSTDSDGSVASYSWDFGDGSAAGTGATPSRTYAAAGTYTVKLTVTDNKGATGTVSHAVTVTAAPVNPNLAADAFGRTVTGGFGSADTGGAWTVAGGAANFAVGSGAGQMKLAGAGSNTAAHLNAVSSTNTDATVDVSLDKPATGGGTYVALVGRGTSSNAYRGKVLVRSTGAVTVYAVRVVAGAETVLATANVSGMTYTAGDVLHLRLQVSGSGTTSLKFKVWKGSDAEPSTWNVSTTDTTASLQSASGVGLWAYLSGSSTNAPVVASFDKLVAKPNN